MLAAMKRGYSSLEYKSIIRRLRCIRPKISITSDFIVGFPGESDDDFEDTVNLIKKIGFDASFSFIYSPRPGTPAAQFPDDISRERKQKRLMRLQKMIEAQACNLSECMVGQIEKILVDGVSKNDFSDLTGRTENNRVVNFKGPSRLIGEFVDVHVLTAGARSLRGEIITH